MNSSVPRKLRLVPVVVSAVAVTVALGTLVAARYFPRRAPTAGTEIGSSAIAATAASGTPSLPAALPAEQCAARLIRESLEGEWANSPDWQRRFESLPAEEFPALMRYARAAWSDPRQHELRATLFSRWTKLDPAAAAAFAWVELSGESRIVALELVCGEWISTDRVATLAWLEGLPAGPVKTRVLAHVAVALAADQPAAALALISALPPSDRADRRSEILRQWIARTPAAAFAHGAQLADPLEREELLQHVVTLWGDTAARDALAAVTALDASGNDSALRAALVNSLLVPLARQDADAAVEFVLNQPASGAREQWMLTLVAALPPEDFELAGALTAAMPSGGRQVAAITQFAANFTQRDPDAAIRWAESLAEGSARHTAREQIALTLAASNPARAAAFASALPPSDSRDEIVSSVLTRWAQADALAALEWTRQLPAGSAQQRGLAIVGEQLAARDPDAAIALATGMLTDSSAIDNVLRLAGEGAARSGVSSITGYAAKFSSTAARESFLGGAVCALSVAEPATAARLLGELTPGAAQCQAAQVVLSHWTSTDPRAAAGWAAAFPAGELRETAVPDAAAQWAAHEPLAAARWLETLPADAARDAAINRFVQQAAGQTPQLAAGLVARVNDSSLRLSATEQLARIWLENDRAAAEAWLQRSGLSEQQRAGLLARLEPGR